jgi:hypothetical protein
MCPIEKVLLWKTFAPSLIGNLEQGLVVGEDLGVGLEDYETAVEVVGTELILVLFCRWREVMVDSYSLLARAPVVSVSEGILTWLCCRSKSILAW